MYVYVFEVIPSIKTGEHSSQVSLNYTVAFQAKEVNKYFFEHYFSVPPLLGSRATIL